MCRGSDLGSWFNSGSAWTWWPTCKAANAAKLTFTNNLHRIYFAPVRCFCLGCAYCSQSSIDAWAKYKLSNLTDPVLLSRGESTLSGVVVHVWEEHYGDVCLEYCTWNSTWVSQVGGLQIRIWLWRLVIVINCIFMKNSTQILMRRFETTLRWQLGRSTITPVVETTNVNFAL